MGEKIFEAKNLSKNFPGVRALNNVSLEINAGEVVGLVGENGAGKSTLLNIMSGLYKQDNGNMFLRGEEFSPNDYHTATMRGVSRVFQELALVPNLTVYENLFLSHESLFSKWGVLDKKKMIAKSKTILSKLHLDIDPTKRVNQYDFSMKQAIEIAKACSISSELFKVAVPLILLDEPTTSLTSEEMEDFFSLINKLKNSVSFVFVSHRLSEILRICDRVYVLKDGEVVDMVYPQRVNEKILHELMVGRKRDEDYYKETDQVAKFGKTVLSVKNLTKKASFKDVSFEIKSGEIVGIGGVIGSGKAELGRAIAGALKVDGGELEFNGVELRNKGLRNLITKGLGYIPGERTEEGIIGKFTIKWNISLASLNDVIGNRIGLLDLNKEKEIARKFIKRLSVKAKDENIECDKLSGGNQQKVVLCKWLMRDMKLLVLDNPTRGIDPGAKEEIYELFRELTGSGLAIIIITDELLELIGISNRVLIMKDGKISAEVDSTFGNKPTEQQLVSCMV